MSNTKIGTVRHYDGPEDQSVWITLTVAGETMFAHQVCPRERGQEVNWADLARAVADMWAVAVSATVNKIAHKAALLG